jgi:hypothetical protein
MKHVPLRRGNWSPAELERLRRLFPLTPLPHVARLLHRSAASVRRRARVLFRRRTRSGPWDEREDGIVRRASGVLELGDLAVVLARTQRDVRARIAWLRTQITGGPWTAAEDCLLKRCYGSRLDADLELCLLQPLVAILGAADRLCLAKDKRGPARVTGRASMPRWSEAELSMLRRLYPDVDSVEVARQLRRSTKSVVNQANRIGIAKAQEARAAICRRNAAMRTPSPVLPAR